MPSMRNHRALRCNLSTRRGAHVPSGGPPCCLGNKLGPARTEPQLDVAAAEPQLVVEAAEPEYRVEAGEPEYSLDATEQDG